MGISFSERFSPQAHVAGKIMDGELVVINLHSGLYYSSVGVGPTIWQLMETGRSCSEIADTVSDRSKIPREQVEADVSAFLEKLLAEDLISPSDIAVVPDAAAAIDYAGPYEAPSLATYDDMEQAFALDPPLRA
jgi:hypothetical protein